MSILLDALKKSEEQRQLGKVPGIHSPAGGVAARRAPTQRWALLLLIAVSAVAIGWFGWQQFQSPEPEAVSADETASVAKEQAIADPGAAATGSDVPAQAPSNDSPAAAVASRRTPVETLPTEGGSDPASGDASPAQATEPRKSRVNESFTAFEAGKQAAGVPPEWPASAAATAPATNANPEPTEKQVRAAPANQAAAPQRAPAEPKATEPISYWELPQGIRDSLPDMHITVLVLSLIHI